MIRDAITYPLRANDPIKTLLIGGFLLATGTVLSLVFVLGYLVRVLAPGRADGSAPPFDRWRALAFDGGRALAIWVAYLAVPLLVLVLWVELYVTWVAGTTPIDRQLLNAVVHGPGIGIGGPIALRPLIQTVYDLAAAGGVFAGVLPLLSALSAEAVVRYLGVAYGATLLAGVYLAPIAIANFAAERTLRSGFDAGTIGNAATDRRYVVGWGCAAVCLLVGAAGPALWNEWRLAALGADWGLLHIGFIPVVAHPTPTGILSVTFLAFASLLNFYLLVVGYALLSSALAPLVAEDGTPTSGAAVDPEDSAR